MADSIKLHEIYFSVQGEGKYAGHPCAFVRTTGCNLRCVWCDTADAFHGGKVRTFDEVLSELSAFPTKLVLITGGEPLLQKSSVDLMECLLKAGYTVSLETGGSYSVAELDPRIHTVVDIKCPGSAEQSKMHADNFSITRPDLEYKFVLANRQDFDYMIETTREHRLHERGTILASPVHGALPAKMLVEWVLTVKDLPIKLNLQLHKYIWGKDAKGV